ncbi:hypothetical protein KIPB_013096, partial [Kipferlia bialata]
NPHAVVRFLKEARRGDAKEKYQREGARDYLRRTGMVFEGDKEAAEAQINAVKAGVRSAVPDNTPARIVMGNIKGKAPSLAQNILSSAHAPVEPQFRESRGDMPDAPEFPADGEESAFTANKTAQSTRSFFGTGEQDAVLSLVEVKP